MRQRHKQVRISVGSKLPAVLGHLRNERPAQLRLSCQHSQFQVVPICTMSMEPIERGPYYDAFPSTADNEAEIGRVTTAFPDYPNPPEHNRRAHRVASLIEGC